MLTKEPKIQVGLLLPYGNGKAGSICWTHDLNPDQADIAFQELSDIADDHKSFIWPNKRLLVPRECFPAVQRQLEDIKRHNNMDIWL